MPATFAAGASIEDLRALIRRIEARRAPARPRNVPPQRPAPYVVDALGGHAANGPLRPRSTTLGECAVVEARYPLSTARVGRQPLASLAAVDGDLLGWLAPGEAVEDAVVDDLLLLDIETTGLGGAGACAFLVAVAYVEGDALVLRQYVARSPVEEGALLVALLEDARLHEERVLVTYNGRAFDAPHLDERATMHRLRGGFDATRNVDLLPPMRTQFRGLFAGCRLAEIEARVLGLERPPGEVAGEEIPRWYFLYLRTGDERFLHPLLVHNALDVLALGGLLARLQALRGEPERASGVEALGIGRLYARRGETVSAAGSLERALAELPRGTARDDALWRLALLRKRAGERERAAPLWTELAERPGPRRLEALVQLAMFEEHDRRDPEAALCWVRAALAVTEGLLPPQLSGATSREALDHRRRRLLRRIERAALGPRGAEAS